MDQRFQEELYEVPALGELELVEVDHRRNLVLEQPTGEQCRVTGIGRQLAAGADQQHVDRFAQTRELALVIQYDGLNPGALRDEAQQPRLTAARIRLNKKSGVDQRGKIEIQLSAADDLPDVHRRFRSRLAVCLTRTRPGINVSPNLSPSVLGQKRAQCFPQPPPAAGNCLHIPRVVGKNLGHQNSHRLSTGGSQSTFAMRPSFPACIRCDSASTNSCQQPASSAATRPVSAISPGTSANRCFFSNANAPVSRTDIRFAKFTANRNASSQNVSDGSPDRLDPDVRISRRAYLFLE